MTTEGILDTLRRSAESERAWDEAASQIGSILSGLDEAEVHKLSDGVARIARDHVEDGPRSASRILQAVLRGASHAFAEATAQQLTDDDLLLVKDSVVHLASLIERGGGLARARDLAVRTGWKAGRVTTTLDELIAGGFVADLVYKGRPAEDKKARWCRILPLGRRLVQLRGSVFVSASIPPRRPEMVVLSTQVAPAPDAVRQVMSVGGRSNYIVSNLEMLPARSRASKGSDEVQV
jgi:DNA-binding MarR family transcriptional regulator